MAVRRPLPQLGIRPPRGRTAAVVAVLAVTLTATAVVTHRSGAGGSAVAPAAPLRIRAENLAGSAAGTPVRATDPRLSWVGRWAVSPSGATTVNGGSRLRFSFTGTRVSARLAAVPATEPAQLYVTVDGRRSQVAVTGSVLPLGSGLRSGRHTVLLEVRALSSEGSRWRRPLTTGVTVTGLDLGPDGRLGARPSSSALRMEFYGDSVTEGVRAAGTELNLSGTDATVSFAALTAAGFGADAALVGFAGQGLTCAGLGDVPVAARTWGSVLAGSRATGPAPAAVVVNYGANDRNASSAAFQAAYTGYLRKVRAGYPKAWIFVVTPFSGTHTTEALRATAALHDRRTVAVDTTGWLPAANLPDGRHPDAAGHRIAATRLVERIRATTGWRPVHSPAS